MAIGYACVTIGVPGSGMSRCNLKNATNEKIRAIISSNLSALETVVDYNIQNNIKLYRISSDNIPFASHPINQIRWWEEEKERLKHIGMKITKARMRVSMHPGQYTVLNASNAQVVQNAFQELIYHEKFLNTLGMDEKSKLVLHIGGVYGNKAMAMNAFVNNYSLLPEEVKNRLVIENDDKNYTIQDVLSIYNEIGSPVVFDTLHHKCNAPKEILAESLWIKKCELTWKQRDGRQKLHYSEQKKEGSSGSHSDTIFLPDFLEFYQGLYNKNIDIMLEVKDKNLSAVKCNNIVLLDATANMLEVEWSRYQYFVLSRSARLSDNIKQLLEDKEAKVAKEFYDIIEQAFILPEDKDAEINAAKHVWGYLARDCGKAEEKRYERLLAAYENGTGLILPVKNHLLKCARAREEYLINSLYFYL